MKIQKEINSIDSFVSSLSCWQAINLKMNFLKLENPDISSEEAYEKSVIDFSTDREELKRDIEQLIGTIMF
ncbi:hypothetical protein ACVPPR_07330 [Dellaglioa sp. L3N]